MKLGTVNHLKFKHLKRLLGGLPDYVVVGLLESLWMVTAQWKDHGGIGEWSNEQIALAIDWQGNADELIAALVKSGWLDESDQHRLVIHDWMDHCPKYVYDRIDKREKRRQLRAEKVDALSTTVADNDPVSSTVADNRRVSTTVADNRCLPSQAKPCLVKSNQALGTSTDLDIPRGIEQQPPLSPPAGGSGFFDDPQSGPGGADDDAGAIHGDGSEHNHNGADDGNPPPPTIGSAAARPTRSPVEARNGSDPTTPGEEKRARNETGRKRSLDDGDGAGDGAGDGFAEFWQAYPRCSRKVDRKTCARHWRANRLDQERGEIVEAVRAWSRSDQWTKDDGQFIPAPLVWLRQRRWEAPPPPPAGRSRRDDDDGGGIPGVDGPLDWKPQKFTVESATALMQELIAIHGPPPSPRPAAVGASSQGGRP